MARGHWLITALAITACVTRAKIVVSSRCACLNSSSITSVSVEEARVHPDLNLTTYGIGCAAHDAVTASCTQRDPNCLEIVPTPVSCPASYEWCDNPWCYVDRDCGLTHETSSYFSRSLRHYSYAACGYRDEWKDGIHQGHSLQGKVLRIGFLSNTGGWKGAYHPIGHGVRDAQWYGPLIDLIQHVATQGGFAVNITDAPSDVKENSGSESSFTKCVFATATGHLDLCIAMFTSALHSPTGTCWWLGPPCQLSPATGPALASPCLISALPCFRPSVP